VVKLVSLAYGYAPTYQNANVPKARSTSIGIEAKADLASWIGLRTAASWTDARNRTPGGRIPVLADTGQPVPYDAVSEKIPYLPVRTASIALDLRPSRGAVVSLSAQHQGAMLIQYFDASKPQAFASETQPYFIPSPSFWTMNARVDLALPKGAGLYFGADNVTDYVDGDLGKKAIDYDWGPIRGRYVFAGISYRFSR
jgi:outer membrane receptor protein involved in Fe transport